jgi:tRNA-dihydrouridine synthase B
MRIGPLELDGNVFLAPMAGFTGWPMRLLCRRMGAAFTFTEMISAGSLVRGRGRARERTEKLMESHPCERPLGMQIFGAQPEIMAEAAAMAEAQGAALIDLNLACPVKKVVKTGAGAALLRDPRKAQAMFGKIRKAIRIPLTIKIRSGWDENSLTAPEIAQRAEHEGVDAVILHARIASQGFAGPADWSMIARTVASVKIPVIGNGDIRSSHEAERMQAETACEAVMIGRAAIGNPWIFREVKQGLSPASHPASATERHELIAEHYRLMIEYLGPHQATLEMRKHLAWYSKGLPGAKSFREHINRTQDPEQVRALIDQYFGCHSLMEVENHA